MFSSLLSPLRVGPVELPNRIASTAHQTTLVDDHLPNDDFVAYHEARARGRDGLIVLEATAVDASGLLTSHTLGGYLPEIVEGYRRVAAAVRPHGHASSCSSSGSRAVPRTQPAIQDGAAGGASGGDRVHRLGVRELGGSRTGGRARSWSSRSGASRRGSRRLSLAPLFRGGDPRGHGCGSGRSRLAVGSAR